MKLTISGPPGSGKTTVAEIVSRRLSLDLVTGGKIFREQANRLRVSLAKLGELAERSDEFDKTLDAYLLDALKENNDVVVESRLAGWLCHMHGIDAFKVYVDAEENVRLHRINKSLKSRKEEMGHNILSQMREREESEWERYKKYYGIDFRDTSIYDLVVDASRDGAEKVAEVIISGLDIWKGTGRKIR